MATRPADRAAGKAKKPTKPAGKPKTPWEQWKAKPEDSIATLCDVVVGGGHLADFAKARGFPYTTMLDWINADPSRSEMYARAREDRSDKLADEIVAISDEAEFNVTIDPQTGETGEVKLDAAAVARNRLRVDARKWVAAKLKPRVYGDKVQVDANVNLRESSDEELAKRLAKFGIDVTAKPAGEGSDGSA